MNIIYKPVLVINASYEPLEITSVREAVKKLVTRKALLQEEVDEKEIRPGMPLPSVIRLVEYRRVHEHTAKLTKKNFFLRDRYRCQYCGERFAAIDLTLDHVVPKSRGGPATWENLVACCRSCNHTKNDRTPAEAGMTLLHKPKTLTVHTSRQLMRRIGLDEDESWGKYLYA